MLYNSTKVVDQIIAALHHVAVLSISYASGLPLISQPDPLHALCPHTDPRAFHAGAAGQLRTFFSLNNVFIVISLAFVVDL